MSIGLNTTQSIQAYFGAVDGVNARELKISLGLVGDNSFKLFNILLRRSLNGINLVADL
jgi:hypothetical protein